ncbi:urease accessory protein UreE [Providencia rettgeri]|uniref:Urease accessory protein UreE n=1 Tax=Providencia rettgeri TaxID=587 RepID=A0A379FVH7_PRORE|nr:urease accessory protein UreE [Providencia rettgeri]
MFHCKLKRAGAVIFMTMWLDDMARGLGATVSVGLEKYQPEPGAYGGSSGGHHHHHGHDDDHH